PRPPPAIYTLSLHDALPILSDRESRRILAQRKESRGACAANAGLRIGRGPCGRSRVRRKRGSLRAIAGRERPGRSRVQRLRSRRDRKSTRLNSSHVKISYAV